MKQIFLQLLCLTVLARPAFAQTVPSGSDNIGGVAAPVGSYGISPGVPLAGLNPYTGNATRTVSDLSVASISEVGLTFTRYCNSRGNPGSQQMGNVASWRHSYQWDFTLTTVNGVSTINLVYPNGTSLSFSQTSPGVWSAPSPVFDVITLQGSSYVLLTSSNIQYVFTSSSFFGVNGINLTKIIDSKGLTTTLTNTHNSGGAYPYTTTITEPGGRYLTLSYTEETINGSPQNATFKYFVTKVTTCDGRYVSFYYAESYYSVGENSVVYPVLQELYNATYSDGSISSYAYTCLEAGSQTLPWGIYALAQADDTRSDSIPNIGYSYFSGTSGAIKSVIEASSNTVICTLSLTNGNNQTPKITFPDNSYFQYNFQTGGLLTGITNSQNNQRTFAYITGTGTWSVASTDSNGYVTNTTYSSSGKLLSIQVPATGNETVGPTQYYYYTAGYLTSFVDYRGYTTSITRNPTSNLITNVSYPDGTSESYQYNSFNEITSHTLRNGGTENFAYDNTGLLLAHQDAAQDSDESTTYGYNSNYRISSVTDANNHTTSFAYNDMGKVTTVTNADGTTKTYAYQAKMVLSIKDELQHTTSYAYDGFNRLLTVTDPLNKVTTYAYNSTTPTNTNPVTITLPSGKVTKNIFIPAWDYETSSTTEAYGTSDAATTSYTYDNEGNAIAVSDPRLNVTLISYDARNRKVGSQDPAGNITALSYDDNSNLVSSTTPDGNSSFVYDSMNEKTQATDPKGNVSKMSYDGGSSLASFTDPNGNVYKYTYDLDERELSMLYPDGTSEQYAYDPVGNLSTYTTRDNKAQQFSYDNRNREVSYTWNDGVTLSTSMGYDNASRLTSLSNSNSALTYT